MSPMVVASLGMSKERVTARLQDEALFTFVCRVSIDSPGLVVISSRVRSRPLIIACPLSVLVLLLCALRFRSSCALRRAYLAWQAATSHVQPALLCVREATTCWQLLGSSRVLTLRLHLCRCNKVSQGQRTAYCTHVCRRQT